MEYCQNDGFNSITNVMLTLKILHLRGSTPYLMAGAMARPHSLRRSLMGNSTALASLELSSDTTNEGSGVSPRIAMYNKLPDVMQPFLTWLTAQPTPGDIVRERSPLIFVAYAYTQVITGVVMGALATPHHVVVLMFAMMLVTAGLGLFQVVVFHHCSHLTVFRRRELNILVGRLISVILLFKHFDNYRHEHMLHHSHNKLLTDEDEFADFVFQTCQLKAGEPIGTLRIRVLLNIISPLFHARFTYRRIRAAWGSSRRMDSIVGITFWAGTGLLAAVSGYWQTYLLTWVIPVTVLLQIATVGRILCEHSFPELDIIRVSGRDLTSHATGGVFAGSMPPNASAKTINGLAQWLGWWVSIVVIQLPVRLVILVGDAPCHDFHHRKPASRRWTSYIQARQSDREARTVGKLDYRDTWGLFQAIDATLLSLSRLPPGTQI